MITNFEDITYELTEEELVMLPICIQCFQQHASSNPIKAPQIVAGMKAAGYRMSEPRLRKIVNHIRSNSLLPLIATHAGYYCSADKEVIQKQITSLRERASSINRCADGLEKFMK